LKDEDIKDNLFNNNNSNKNNDNKEYIKDAVIEKMIKCLSFSANMPEEIC
jgi:hypothetical protein